MKIWFKYLIIPFLMAFSFVAIGAFSENVKTITVIIDPGHGGKDSGAIGFNKHQEKDIVLAISKNVVRLLNNQKLPDIKFHAIITRNDDHFLHLWERLLFSKKYKANLFISIHADAHYNKEAQGATVFALSLKGATSAAARYLAKRENESVLGHQMLDNDRVLKSVILELVQNASIKKSLEIGMSIKNNLKSFTKLHHEQIEQANFVVLKEPEVPSLLIETGFISNKDEEKKLIDKDYQLKLAKAIVKGITDYYCEHQG